MSFFNHFDAAFFELCLKSTIFKVFCQRTRLLGAPTNYVLNGGFERPEAGGTVTASEWANHGELGYRRSEEGAGRVHEDSVEGNEGVGAPAGTTMNGSSVSSVESGGSSRRERGGYGVVVSDGGGVTGVGGAWQNVVVAQSSPAPLVLEGWSRPLDTDATSIDGTGGLNDTARSGSDESAIICDDSKSEDPTDYCLYADITFTDGSHRWAFVVPFRSPSSDDASSARGGKVTQLGGIGGGGGGGGGSGGGSGGGIEEIIGSEHAHGARWRHAYGIIDEDKAVLGVTLVLMHRHRTGTVIFDDVSLSPLREALCHLPLSAL